MGKIVGSLGMGFGTYWAIQSGILSSDPEVVVDKGLVVFGTAALGCGLYCVGASHGFNHGFRKGTQQVIKHHNSYRI